MSLSYEQMEGRIEQLEDALHWALDWIEKCAEVPLNMDGEEGDWQALCAAWELLGESRS